MRKKVGVTKRLIAITLALVLSASPWLETISVSYAKNQSTAILSEPQELNNVRSASDSYDAETPVITKNLTDYVDVVDNYNYTLSIEAEVSRGTLTYEWYSNSKRSTEGSKRELPASEYSTLHPKDTIHDQYFYCIITNTDESATGQKTASVVSNIMYLERVEMPDLYFLSDLSDITVERNSEPVFKADIDIFGADMYNTNTGILSYQWYKNITKSNKNGVMLEGATGPEYTPETDTAGTTYYYCEVSYVYLRLSKGPVHMSTKSNAVQVNVGESEQESVYEVTYNRNRATGGKVPVDTKEYSEGNRMTVLGNTGKLNRTGYTFAGWTLNEDGTGTIYKAGDRIRMENDVTLYAKWVKSAVYKVTYDKNRATGGRVPVDANKYKNGNSVIVKNNTGRLTRKGYVFAGWTLNKNGSGKVYKAGNRIRITRNATLYAKWVKATARLVASSNTLKKGRTIYLMLKSNASVKSVRWSVTSNRYVSIRTSGPICKITGKVKNRKVIVTARIVLKDGTRKTLQRVVSVR